MFSQFYYSILNSYSGLTQLEYKNHLCKTIVMSPITSINHEFCVIQSNPESRLNTPIEINQFFKLMANNRKILGSTPGWEVWNGLTYPFINFKEKTINVELFILFIGNLLKFGILNSEQITTCISTFILLKWEYTMEIYSTKLLNKKELAVQLIYLVDLK